MDQPGEQFPHQQLATPQSRASRRNKLLLAAFVAIAVIALVIWALVPPSEPTYKDHSLSYWITLFNDSGNPRDPNDFVTAQCREALTNMRPQVVPHLVQMMRATHVDWATQARKVLRRLRVPYVGLPYHEPPEYNAEVGLYLLGDLATNAIPDLINICNGSGSKPGKSAADRTLMSLYPAAGTEEPSWVPMTNRAAWYLEAGGARLQKADLSNAVRAFSQAIKIDPTNADALLLRGSTRISLKDFAGALTDLSQALSLQSSNAEALVQRASCYGNMHEFSKADADCTAAITIDTNNIAAYNMRGLVRMNLRQFDAATDDFTRAIEIAPSDPNGYGNRARIEMLKKDLEHALADVSKSIQLEPKNPVPYSIRAGILSSLKDYRGALLDLDQAIAFNPNDYVAYSTRGWVHVNLDEFPAADADIAKALNLEPDFPGTYLIRSFLEAKREHGQRAISDLEHVVEVVPQSAEACAALALLQYRFADRKTALATIEKSMNSGGLLNQSELRAYQWLIRTEAGEKDRANSELQAYLITEEAQTNAWVSAIARFLTGRLSESEFLALAPKAIRRPSEIQGQVCDSYYYAGMKRKFAGELAEAKTLFQRCLDTKYDNAYGYMNAIAEMRTLNAAKTN